MVAWNIMCMIDEDNRYLLRDVWRPAQPCASVLAFRFMPKPNELITRQPRMDVHVFLLAILTSIAHVMHPWYANRFVGYYLNRPT